MSLLLKGIKLLAQNLINRLFLGSCQQFSCALPNATPCKRTRSQFLIRRYEFLKLHDHWPHYRIGTFQSKSRVHLSWQASKKLKSSFTWKRQPPVHLADDDASFERIGKCRREQTLHSEGEKNWKLSSELSIFFLLGCCRGKSASLRKNEAILGVLWASEDKRLFFGAHPPQ